MWRLSFLGLALAQTPVPQKYTVGDLISGQSPSVAAPVTAPAPSSFNPLAVLGNAAGNTPALMARSDRKISRRSRDVVEGIIESYMHRVTLERGEKRCLERNTGQLASDVMGTGDDLVTAVKGLVEQGEEGNINMEPTGGLMMAVPTVVDAATKVTSMVRLTERLVKQCVQGDAMQALNTTATHLENMTYIGNRLMANGADIAEELAKCVKDWQREDFRRVGEDVGTAMRKVLLSKASTEPALPEGEPPVEIINQVTEGLTEGFFVPGMDVKIKDLAAPDVNVKIDLNKCINRNQPLFRQSFKAVWALFAQMSANKEQFGLEKSQIASNQVPLGGKVPLSTTNAQDPLAGAKNFMGENSEWMSAAALAMMQVPGALQKCNIGPETEKMLGEAIHSLKYAKVKFDMPGQTITQKETSLLMSDAVESWTRWRFEDFGKDVGELLREMVLLVYPQKYSIDERGILRRALEPTEAKAEPLAEQHPPGISGSTLTVGIALAFLSIPAFFFGSRSLQMCQRQIRYNSVLERCAPPEDSRTLPMTAADVHPVTEALVPMEEVLVQ